MSIIRKLWLNRIEEAWQSRSIVWLSGVRRVGKTTLTRMLPDAKYVNCDLPASLQETEDPYFFLDNQSLDKPLILDEIHQLRDPSKLLKIAADEFPALKILATGSSTLAATQKFSDSLTGRKQSIHLSPVLWEERGTFAVDDLDTRLLHGGMPEQLLAERKSHEYFNEWIDSFFARDIQELFGFRNRQGFLALFRLLLRQSGGQLDYSKMASSLDSISRPTVISHVSAMEIAHAVFLLSPYSGGGRREIISRPKCYTFDTGFATFEKGWETLRAEDRGLLWEHLVLDSLRFRFADNEIFYWQDKSGREIDFVVRRSRDEVDVFECKINPEKFDPANMAVFREFYPEGNNYVVSPSVKAPYKTKRNGLIVTNLSTEDIE